MTVPREIVLGSLMFMVYAICIVNVSDALSLILFADDTAVNGGSKKILFLCTILNVMCFAWVDLTMNVGKYKYIS